MPLTDTAVLAGGDSPTGSITFTLTGPASFTSPVLPPVPVNGNGTYSVSTTVSIAGTYTWTAQYSGDTNNDAATDQGGTAEQTVVAQAVPTLTTTATPATAPISPAPELSDVAELSGGDSPTGQIVFTLTSSGQVIYTTMDTVSGDNTYSASTTLAATDAAGTYVWTAQYSGDTNNSAETSTAQTVVTATTTTSPSGPSGPTVSMESPPHLGNVSSGSLTTASKTSSSGVPTGGVATGGGTAGISGWLLTGMILGALGLLVLAGGAVMLRRQRA